MIARYLRRILAEVVLLLLAAGLVLFFTSHLDDFDFDNAVAKELTFTSQGNTLSGTLLLPGSGYPAAIAVIIHGDGPQDRYSDNGYNPLFNTLLDAGIAVFSWDKAGTGSSQGNWLHQSMDDRAAEAVAALTLIQSRYQNTPVQVGFLGFSQAGWVIPVAAAQSQPDFSVIIGGAVNWRDQGQFYQGLRYAQQGKSQAEITQLLTAEQAENDRIFGTDGSKDPAQRGDMTPDRFEFVVKNYLSDATPALPQMNGRVLAVWGAEDLNVDARQNACRYQLLLKDNPKANVVVFPQAGHGLLQAPAFNYQLSSDWPVLRQWQFLYTGRGAYYPGTLSLITDWIKDKTPDLTAYYPVCQP
ncbi:alpha/beta hydrolase family protein [Morganella morganii]|uniref:alpha/beta hydrolase family protein n=1 Tax=Morganella morganii TaxID=582 RepID=UPI0021D08C89|nr:alpha/beta hydrolase [Morganella morganii]MCU6376789.1 alpha/beta hydrolase [Morganella morganii]